MARGKEPTIRVWKAPGKTVTGEHHTYFWDIETGSWKWLQISSKSEPGKRPLTVYSQDRTGRIYAKFVSTEKWEGLE